MYRFDGLKWDVRNEEISRLIPSRSSVLDYGGGREGLRPFLVEPSHYVSVDAYPCTDETQVVDLDSEQIPSFGRFSFAVMSGLLEYLHHPVNVLRAAYRDANKAIVSYNFGKKRHEYWVNDFSRESLEALFFNAGWKVEKVVRIGLSRQYLFVLKSL